ncbi:hypothetical protein PCASD_16234 [Puccinia coronata f. sp. avenae]|uniref:Uncharacterized protein n=1 Tax=Puccinia coronata f. sp. avenae TaxID=200324 RepID=A0A2N5TBF5_9BASI|nr:hypothetical protein PCASD_16234 [Puccinia coronata f. sp. avenae]
MVDGQEGSRKGGKHAVGIVRLHDQLEDAEVVRPQRGQAAAHRWRLQWALGHTASLSEISSCVFVLPTLGKDCATCKHRRRLTGTGLMLIGCSSRAENVRQTDPESWPKNLASGAIKHAAQWTIQGSPTSPTDEQPPEPNLPDFLKVTPASRTPATIVMYTPLVAFKLRQYPADRHGLVLMRGDTTPASTGTPKITTPKHTS